MPKRRKRWTRWSNKYDLSTRQGRIHTTASYLRTLARNVLSQAEQNADYINNLAARLEAKKGHRAR